MQKPPETMCNAQRFFFFRDNSKRKLQRQHKNKSQKKTGCEYAELIR